MVNKLLRSILEQASAVLPIGDRFAQDKRKFKKKRAEFYHDLAQTMEAQPTVNIAVHLERMAERYPREPKGRLAARWLDNYRMEGSFSEAIRDSVPPEDYAPLMIAERAGDLKRGLSELATVVSALDATKQAINVIWFSTIFAFICLQIFIGWYAFSIVPQIEAAIPKNVEISDLGFTAVLFHTMSVSVRNFWPLWILFIVAGSAALVWSVKNYVGPYRQWLDRHVLHYKLYAEFQAISFFVALAAVTQRINNRVLSVPNALQLMQPTATPWLAHHIRRILANHEENPHAKGENFQVGMVSRDTEFRMLDIAEYADVSKMLRTVAQQSLERSPKEMERRAFYIQNWCRVFLVVTVLLIQFGFYVMSWNLQDAISMSSYLPAR